MTGLVDATHDAAASIGSPRATALLVVTPANWAVTNSLRRPCLERRPVEPAAERVGRIGDGIEGVGVDDAEPLERDPQDVTLVTQRGQPTRGRRAHE